ncbi:MAG: DNA translocase FtsK [Lachnospiraceae bacterium]|jgi:S-DNA-T family DNA segregation ATPase FtsK/SpoIIIE|nr:DNA translocase FtsK [Lachnospiraceae bacterium]
MKSEENRSSGVTKREERQVAGASQKAPKRTSAGTGQRKTAQNKSSQKTSQSRTTQSRTSQSRGAKQPARRSTKKAAGADRRREPLGIESFVGKEILILALFAVCLLLFLSNLGLCGAAGTAIREAQCGVFGILGYLFPVGLFTAVLFYLSNRYHTKAMVKLAVAVALFFVACGLIGLMTTKDFDQAATVAQYYAQSAKQPGGGAVGGLFLKLLCPAVGKLGAWIIGILLAVMGAVFITERSVLEPIGRGGRKVYDTAREDVARRREIHAAREEEKRRYRLEQKVSGVAWDTTVGDPEAGAEPDEEEREDVWVEEPEEPAMPSEQHTRESAPEQETREEKRPPIRISGIGFEKEEEPPMALSSDEDVLIARKDTRTLAELEALDSLHSSVFAGARQHVIWGEEDEGGDAVPVTGNEVDLRDLLRDGTEAPKQPEEEQRKEGQEETQPREQPEEWQIKPWEEAAKTAVPVAMPEPDDVKRVVTAGGKVVEVDIDPDDDPLTRKRMEQWLAKQEPAGGDDGPRGSMGDTVHLAGAQGGGRLGIMEPEEPPKKYQKPDYDETALQPEKWPQHGGQAGISSGRAAASAGQPETKRPPVPPKPYVRPPYNLMKSGNGQRKNSDRELRETARKLETTLQNFGVGVTVTNISCGPSVTRYEIQPEQGVRVSKIVGLADDIKLNLAAADIRIEAPIPNKASVGIEVPNKENSTVFLREVLESKAFTEHPSKLAFAVGKDISGDVVVTDLAKMPHLLIAGATGSGKSVCINTLIMSVLYKAKPEEVRLIMVDPKVVELSIYNGIPHLMIPVVTDPKKAAGALGWAVAEMTERYRRFAEWNVRDLKGYNEKLKEEAEKNKEDFHPVPQIVIIVDELADLMMVSPGDVEDAICRLAQMARAAGLHLVIATQRPSVNVITGLIKANVPSRIAFSVSSGVDSRTIIDMNGAEKLLGKGDMLFYPSGYPKPVRVQGAFVSDTEVGAVVEFLKENNESLAFDSAVEARLSGLGGEGPAAGAGGDGPERDEYFAKAGRYIIEKQKASIGRLQQVFRIGFNRAARIMDQLADAGVVSEDAGTKAREILMDINQYEELLQELGLM